MSKTILSLVTLILAQFVPSEELNVVMEAVAILIIWWSRYSVGDISPLGIRK